MHGTLITAVVPQTLIEGREVDKIMAAIMIAAPMTSPVDVPVHCAPIRKKRAADRSRRRFCFAVSPVCSDDLYVGHDHKDGLISDATADASRS